MDHIFSSALSEDTYGYNRARIAAIFDEKFAGMVGPRFFEVRLDKANDFCLLSVILKNPDESFYYPVHAKINITEQDIDMGKAFELMLDYVDIYFMEYFRENENVFIPIDWASYTFEGYELFMHGQVFNNKLEKMADALLSGADLD